MAKNIGRLTVDLRLVSQKFEAGLKRATGNLTKFRATAQSATRSMTGMQAQIAGIVGVAGFGALINNSLKTVDSLAKVSDRLGIATQSLAGLRFAAEQTGASSEALDMGLQRMVRRIGQVAATGKGEAAPALERLGIAIEDIKNLSPEQQFALISEKMKGVANQGERVFITQKLFDSEGVKLLNTLNLGQQGLSAMISEAEKLGIAVNRIEAAKIEAANDAINRAQQAVQGVGNSLAIELAPIIKVVADQFVAASSAGEGFGNKIKGVIERSAGFIGVFADGIHGIQVILKAAEVGVRGFGAVWASTMEFVINQVLVPFANQVSNFVLAPIRGVLEFAAQYSDTAKEMLGSLSSIGSASGFEFIASFKNAAVTGYEESLEELQELLMQTIPSASMKEQIAEIFATAQEEAKKVADNVKDTTENVLGGDEQKKEKEKERQEEEVKQKSHLDTLANLQLGNSKKILALQKAYKLKQAIMAGFVAVQEAWASAPFPWNIPAVAIATASSFANVAGIRGVAHSGIDNVPREGTWLLDKGERVVDSRTNSDLKNYLKRSTQQTNQEVAVNYNFYGNPAENERMLNNNRNATIRDARRLSDELGRPY